MATSLYSEIEADLRLKGDELTIDGTTLATGLITASAGISGKCDASVGGLYVAAPSGTTVGDIWTSGAPVLTAGQKFITLTCGATAYRIPVWTTA